MRSIIFRSAALGVALMFFGGAPGAAGAALTEKQAIEVATEAYSYGYPLVTMEMTRRVVTNVEKPLGPHAPMGQLILLREYPTPAFRMVTAPNADTLYASAFFDVGKEPWVLSLP